MTAAMATAGPEGFVELAADTSEETYDDELQNSAIQTTCCRRWFSQPMREGPRKGRRTISIDGNGLRFAAQPERQDQPAKPYPARRQSFAYSKCGATGPSRGCRLAETAFVRRSEYRRRSNSLIGGFDYNHNNFNHVTQAWRQPGSSFKPFIYSAALEKASRRRR